MLLVIATSINAWFLTLIVFVSSHLEVGHALQSVEEKQQGSASNCSILHETAVGHVVTTAGIILGSSL